MVFFGDNMVDKLVHAVFALEMICIDAVDTASVRLYSEHLLLKNHLFS